jgi:hypothetical protein
VVSLALDLRPKLSYVDDASEEEKRGYEELRNLGAKSVDKDFEALERLFFIERDFLEKNGITRYEFKHAPLGQYVLGGMGRK